VVKISNIDVLSFDLKGNEYAVLLSSVCISVLLRVVVCCRVVSFFAEC